MKDFPVIGIVGMPGSGKTVLSEKFIENGWKKVYFGSVTLKELDHRNLPYNPQNEKSVREELRRVHGQDAFAKILLPEIEALSQEGPVVLDGLYSWSEYKCIEARFGKRLKIIAVVTNSGLRYERLGGRTIRPLTREEAIKRDFAEIENLEKGGPISIADYYVVNNTDVEAMFDQFEALYNELNDISK